MASEWVPMKPCEKGSHKSEDLKLGVSGVVFALLHFRMLRVSGQLPSPTPGMLLGLLLVWLLSCSISLCHGYFDNPLYPEMSNGTLHLYFMPANSEKSLGELENKFRQGQEHESHEKSHLNDDFLGMLVHAWAFLKETYKVQAVCAHCPEPRNPPQPPQDRVSQGLSGSRCLAGL